MGKTAQNADYAHTVPELSPADLKDLQPEMMMRLIGTQDRTGKPNLGMVSFMRHAWPDKVASARPSSTLSNTTRGRGCSS